MSEFLLGAFETDRDDHEILTEIHIPAVNGGAAYRRFVHGERPTVGVAAVLRATAGRLDDARVWIGAVGERPAAAERLEQALTGISLIDIEDVLSAEARVDAERIEVDEDEHGSEDYKRHLTCVFIERSVRAAAASLVEGKAVP